MLTQACSPAESGHLWRKSKKRLDLLRLVLPYGTRQAIRSCIGWIRRS